MPRSIDELERVVVAQVAGRGRRSHDVAARVARICGRSCARERADQRDRADQCLLQSRRMTWSFPDPIFTTSVVNCTTVDSSFIAAPYIGGFQPGGTDWTAGWTAYPNN